MKKALIILSLLFYSLGFSQSEKQNETQKDPKIGLVLSGGGAKGLAHIGVLQTIDSLGIKVDYIAGTSMGAIIGSLYASGYSGNQLDSIFKSINFTKLISDNVPRASKTFYERDNSEKYAVTLPFDNFKVSLPSAISRGQNVYNLLSKLTMHVSEINDFSKLPIPFFCVATNIETGEAVILDNGVLPQAVMASSALPSLFRPVYINNQMLIDGGVVNNYPIKELKEKGVDIIIGVDVQDALSGRKNLKSAPNILMQISNFRTINDMKIKSKLTDVHIKPNIESYSVVSFADGKQIIENGKIAALNKINQLKEIKLKQKGTHIQKVEISDLDSLKLNIITIKGRENYSRAYVLGKLKLKENEKISYQDFIQGANNLVATNNFDSYSYKFTPTKNGYNLTADVKENQSRTFAKFALHYDGLYKSAVLLNLTHKRLLANNDVASLDLILGDNIRYDFEYYIDNGFYWSVGVRSRFNTFNKDINASLILTDAQQTSLNLNKVDVTLSDFTNQIYLQTVYDKNFAFTIGAEHKHLHIFSETFLESSNNRETTFENSNYISVLGNLKLDTYDSKYFPTKGFYFNGDFNLYLYSSDYNNDFNEFSIAKADIGYAFKITQKLSANIISQGGFRLGDNSTNSLNFALGGYGNNFINNFKSFYGYDYISLTGNSFVKGGVNLDYEIFNKNHLKLAANFANIDDNIFDSGEWITSPDYSGYALGYAVDSILGPIEATYSWSPETKESKWFFNLGFWF